jgi:hypothetical protein
MQIVEITITGQYQDVYKAIRKLPPKLRALARPMILPDPLGHDIEFKQKKKSRRSKV